MCGIFDAVFFSQEAKANAIAASSKNEIVRTFILSKLIKVHYNTSLINTESLLHVNAESFENIALEMFRYQYAYNPLYREYCDALHTDVAKVKDLTEVPFLPISFFKTHAVITSTGGEAAPAAPLVFESSGTTGETPSRHYVTDAGLYERSLQQGFEQFYGAPGEYAILALLPSYLERKNASLVHMARVLMAKCGHKDNGFYISEWERLHETLQRLEQQQQKVLLLGVTFALLDFAAAYPMRLTHTIVMETGGMKGRKEEMTREEVHAILKKQWQLQQVHSEYGMTELLSQAYAVADGIFKCTNTMRVLVRDINDPLEVNKTGSGVLNIIDLANVNSCSFIATEDIGSIAADGTFRVLGRMDHSALRGCSLMAV
jgi:phenylacetate-coenzyme A ligase PaaK-like adenylate-forming protein